MLINPRDCSRWIYLARIALSFVEMITSNSINRHYFEDNEWRGRWFDVGSRIVRGSDVVSVEFFGYEVRGREIRRKHVF